MSAVIAEGLAKLYPRGVWGARNISFEAPWRSITVLLGPNGAGKTTTIGMLTTVLRPTRGRALVAGHDVVKEPWEVRKRIALCPQDVRVDPWWTPREAVVGFLMSRGWSRSDAERAARRWLEVLDLWSVRDRPAVTLSGGQSKRIAVAMTLACEAEVTFLDEPTAGLDVEARYRVWSALRELIRDGRCVIMTTHDMKEAEMVADYVVMIARGEVIATGRPSTLIEGLGYRYKVIAYGVKGAAPRGGIKIGDRVIAYARDRAEAARIAQTMIADHIVIERVSLEDVYMKLVGESA